MSREIRISIDDDEVFERMKARKQELDLSWEEVLHRGLRREPPAPAEAPGPHSQPDPQPEPRGQHGHHRSHRHHEAERRHEAENRREGDRWDAFAEDLESQIQNKVYDTLRSSFGAAGIDVPEHPDFEDEEMARLEHAEDAVLAFDFLEDDPGYQIPLRVTLETSRDGLAVDVVAVRQGKSVRHMNSFDTGARREVNTDLATGGAASLRFEDGAEAYRVLPVLTWTRDADGNPTVDGVEIDEVLLDDAE